VSEVSVKTCNKCKAEKPLTEFHKSVRNRGGLTTLCKSCNTARAKVYAAKNKERVLAKVREWCKKNPDKSKEYRARWLAKHPGAREQVSHKSKLKQYGLTPEDYTRLLILQAASCKICGTHQMVIPYKLCVDHCHKTGKVRGLLCRECNHAIGLLKDDAFRADCAAQYLRGSQNA